jgi:hypothetical protein
MPATTKGQAITTSLGTHPPLAPKVNVVRAKECIAADLPRVRSHLEEEEGARLRKNRMAPHPVV